MLWLNKTRENWRSGAEMKYLELTKTIDNPKIARLSIFLEITLIEQFSDRNQHLFRVFLIWLQNLGALAA